MSAIDELSWLLRPAHHRLGQVDVLHLGELAAQRDLLGRVAVGHPLDTGAGGADAGQALQHASRGLVDLRQTGANAGRVPGHHSRGQVGQQREDVLRRAEPEHDPPHGDEARQAELEADVRRTLGLFLYGGSGDAPAEKRGRVLFTKNGALLGKGPLPETFPSWLTREDLDFFTHEFEQTGFRGGLNWYRNIDRMWELTRFLVGAKVQQPSLFAAGEFDAVITMYRQAFDVLEETMPGLKVKTLLPGAGHWIQQERPSEINRLLIDFLNSVR